MNTPTLPEPIAAYFVADERGAEALARCFTATATVKDEGHVHEGVEAIQAWKAAASSAYSYTVAPFALQSRGNVHVVRARVTGTFPGSPVDLRYHFHLERGLIASLEVAA
jgi:hypothetical protein